MVAVWSNLNRMPIINVLIHSVNSRRIYCNHPTISQWHHRDIVPKTAKVVWNEWMCWPFHVMVQALDLHTSRSDLDPLLILKPVCIYFHWNRKCCFQNYSQCIYNTFSGRVRLVRLSSASLHAATPVVLLILGNMLSLSHVTNISK